MNVKFTKKDAYVIVGTLLFILVASLFAYFIREANGPNIRSSGPAPTAPATPGIGDTVRSETFKYTIDSAERNGEVITLHVRVENTSNKAHALYPGTIKLRAGGSYYDHDSDTLTEMTLNPGMTSEGTVTFKLPEHVSGLRAAINADAIGLAVSNALGNDADFKYVDIGL